jgi:hypothetical protein
MDGVPIKFLKMMLPHILAFIKHIFNTILTTSSYPQTWIISKIMQLAKASEPTVLAD